MTPKRIRVGEGIYQRGNSYQLVVSVKGVQYAETLPQGSTLKQAEHLRWQRRAELEQGIRVGRKALTVRGLLDQWLGERSKTARSSNTLRIDRTASHWITGAIGHTVLQKLTVADVDRARDGMTAAGLNAKTVRIYLAVLHTAVKWAVKRELVLRNVVALCERPAYDKPEIVPLSEEQASRVLKVLLRAGPPHGSILALGLLVPVRIKSEFGALRWRDVDLHRGTISINRAMLQDGSVVAAGRRKHKARLLELPPLAVDILKAQWQWQTEELRLPDSDLDRLVFTNSNGQRLPHSTLTTVFKRCLRSAGLPHKRIHDLRHTAATNMLRHGVPIKAVQDVLNHSTAKLTLDTYAHLVPGMTKEALLAWAALLEGSAEGAVASRERGCGPGSMTTIA